MTAKNWKWPNEQSTTVACIAGRVATHPLSLARTGFEDVPLRALWSNPLNLLTMLAHCGGQRMQNDLSDSIG